MLHNSLKTPTLSFRYKKGYFVKDSDSAIKKIETNKVKRQGIKADAASGIANERSKDTKGKLPNVANAPT